MNCPVCGAENESGAAFCFRCGSALQSSARPTTGPTVNLGSDRLPPTVLSPPPSDRPWPLEAPASSPSLPARDDAQEGGARVYQVPPSSPGGPYVVGSASSMPQTSNLAVIALILGIVSWVFLPFIGAIGAVITGHMGRREVQASGGRLTGDGLALAGLILGYLNLAVFVLAAVGFCLFVFAVGNA